MRASRAMQTAVASGARGGAREGREWRASEPSDATGGRIGGEGGAREEREWRVSEPSDATGGRVGGEGGAREERESCASEPSDATSGRAGGEGGAREERELCVSESSESSNSHFGSERGAMEEQVSREQEGSKRAESKRGARGGARVENIMFKVGSEWGAISRELRSHLVRPTALARQPRPRTAGRSGTSPARGAARRTDAHITHHTSIHQSGDSLECRTPSPRRAARYAGLFGATRGAGISAHSIG